MEGWLVSLPWTRQFKHFILAYVRTIDRNANLSEFGLLISEICTYSAEENRTERLKDSVDSCPPCSQVFANYSSLSSGPPINIAATELRGITIEQLSSLQLGLDARAIVDFVSAGIMRAKSREKSRHIRNRRPNWAPRLVFVEDIASSWCEAHHLGYGQPLSFEARCWHPLGCD